MIVVTAELLSAITPDNDAHLCSVEICNDGGMERDTRADYDVTLYDRGGRRLRTARVENWPRKARPAWRLVQAAFAALEDPDLRERPS